MSGVSTASAAVPAGLGALLGVAPERSGSGGSATAQPSSFGAALASAERMLRAAADLTLPSDAAAVTSSEVAAPPESADGTPEVDVESEGQPAPGAGSPVPIVGVAASPIAPLAEPSPHSAVAEDAIAEDARTASSAPDADVLPTTDADAPVIPVASARATDDRAGDPQPRAAAIVSPATSIPVSDTPVVRAESVMARSSSAAPVPSALPVAPAATAVPEEAGVRTDQPPQPPAASATAPVVPISPTSAPVVTAPDAAAAVPRAVAAQVAPVVLSIVQRPVGSHQLTMTVDPDTLGPVTVRAHISTGGEVRVELIGATDAGRDALRTIVTDLRRDLAAVLPHASLTLGSGTAADAGSSDRGTQPGSGSPTGEHASGERGRRPLDPHPSTQSSVGGIPRSLPITTRAGSGEGLDIFA